MHAFAIIPARGGSKRLPRKNVLHFLGRPIIAYTIEAALQSKLFEKVVVSTEDAEIAAIAIHYGATVDHRREELAADAVGLVDVCVDFIDREAEAGRHWSNMACLYATAPLRNLNDIRSTVALLQNPKCKFAMAVTPFHHQPHQALKMDSEGWMSPMWPEMAERRASDFPVMRAGNGTTYAVDVEAFCRTRSFYGTPLRGYEMPFMRSVDIDTQEDFDLALLYAKTMHFPDKQ